MKPLYINGVGCISPQVSFGDTFLSEIKQFTSNRLRCVEPDYAGFLEPGGLRRMSRCMKFSTTAALMALRDTGIETPGGISTGTGYGLLENSEMFLRSVIDQNESIVSPTPFIQSTHNTVGGNIALLTGCNAHNNTFSQKGFSFESALTDAQIMLTEGANNFLVGAYDELTDTFYTLLSQLNSLKNEQSHNLQLFEGVEDGTIAGEGAAFFVLSEKRSEKTYGSLFDIQMFEPANAGEAKRVIIGFLERNDLKVNTIDVLLSGICGDKHRDNISRHANELFATSTIAAFKHLCGEYMTASSFGFWLAAKMMKSQTVPDILILGNKNRQPKNVLLYNSYKNNHTLILFKAC